jgi:hypothetical protein
MAVKIEKNVPKPKKWSGSGPRVYPWEKLKKGECIQVRGSGVNLANAANRRYAPKRFEAGVIDGVHRVWRIA